MNLNPQILHTMIRVRNLPSSLTFYCDALGMSEIARLDFEEGRYSLVYLGYGSDPADAMLELTFNWDRESAYDHGDAYGHIAVGVDDLTSFCDALREAGVEIVREPGPMTGSPFVIAFAQDPDGYKVELIQRPFDPAGAGGG
ncbi:lactoylglutathione lyase [Croceicoccus estronivorus]|uniref:lactoylglutathione lyase n=1 Tax=Croceicoccus estronivorus TaxID=1172626 RepID=UPI00082F7BC2|nr:lactoylglutathione lyase [Croceicoccus estronivorus]OCC23419.1 lactoylglutathione lyase [Croceicoccus estronivorus]